MSGIEAMSERQIQNLRRMRDRLLPRLLPRLLSGLVALDSQSA